MLLVAVPAQAADEPGPAPANSVLLFVAGWCAPCRGELAALPDLRRAAAPRRVLVVPIEADRATARMIAGIPADQILLRPPAVASALMRTLAGTAPGLPISVITDGRGRTCAVHRRPLAAADIAALIARC